MTSILPRLRRARCVHFLQLLVFVFWVMNPFPGALSYWTDQNGDRVKEEVADPEPGDSWWDQDSDGDGLTNAEEAVFGSDPYQIDADFDGLTDLVERDYADPSQPYDPWNWDSDGDGYSDHDEYYQRLWGYSLQVSYTPLQPGSFYSYSDADGDGTKNPDDSDPLNTDRDGDGTVNWQDGLPYFNNVGGEWMDDVNNGVWQDPGVYIGGTWYPSGTVDSDYDGTPDHLDAFPYGSFYYNGTEYSGSWYDGDGDGVPDVADSYPNDYYNGAGPGFEYGGSWYSGTWQDSDSDGIPDVADSWPYDATNGANYYYNGNTYSGYWSDQDGDGVPDPADSHSETATLWSDFDGDGRNAENDSHPDYSGLWSDWNSDGDNNDTDGDEDGAPDVRDSHPRQSWQWMDWDHNGIHDDPGSDHDGDSQTNESDSHPANGGLWSDWNFDGDNNNEDGDEDGHTDANDSHPRDPSLWSDWNLNGSNSDGDGDEDGYGDTEDSHPRNMSLRSDWDGNGMDNDADWDEDGTPNAQDTDPRNPAIGQDTDRDGRPDTEDSHPQDQGLWSDWNGDGDNNDEDGDEDGCSDSTDTHPRNAALWSDSDGDARNADNDSHPLHSDRWSDWNNDGDNNEEDGDEDGHVNANDSDPHDAALHSDWNHDGDDNADDGDEDGAPNGLDSHPHDPALWGDWNYDGTNETPADNADGDARDNLSDSDPTNPNLWSDWNHDGDNCDYDVDEDNVYNEDDSHPLDSTLWSDWNRDGDNNDLDWDEDGYLNSYPNADGVYVPSQDSHPHNNTQWSDWNNDGDNNDADGDEDGVINGNDSHPFYAGLSSDWNYDGDDNNTDGDEDGVVDYQDSHPFYAGLSSDWNNDGDDNADDWDEDGRSNGNDSHPANSALWEDYDGDGRNAESDSHPQDGSLWSDWDGNGINNDTDGDEDGWTDVTDSDPRNPALWIDLNRDGYNDGSEPTDRDGDGLLDPDDAYPDDPYNNADSDMDGLSDYDEFITHGTDRFDVDSDDDFLTDYEELLVYHTNPLAAKSNPSQLYTDYYTVDQTDTDADGIPDRIEQWYAERGFGLNANDPNDAAGDLDGDGVSNLQAYQSGWSLTPYLDTYDADEDRIPDAVEDHWAVRAPGSLDKNVFADAVADFDNDGVMNFEEITLRLNLAASDSGRGDGLMDITVLGQTETLTTRVAAHDCDGDGMTDVWEYRYHLNLRDAEDAGPAADLLPEVPAPQSWEEFVIAWDPSGASTPTGENYQQYLDNHAQLLVLQAKTDPDGDKLPNRQEFALGTHPRIADTDNDGYDDGAEVLAGSNAAQGGSTPVNVPGGGGNNNNNPPPPLVITLAGRNNAVFFESPQRDMTPERRFGASEVEKQHVLTTETGWQQVSEIDWSDPASQVLYLDDSGELVPPTWQLERTGFGGGVFSHTKQSYTDVEPQPIIDETEIRYLISHAEDGPEIEQTHLKFQPPEPDKNGGTPTIALEEAKRGKTSEESSTFYHGNWREYWLRANTAVPEAVSRSYLICKTDANGIKTYTSCTLTIPKDGTFSTQGGTNNQGTIELHPAQDETMSAVLGDLKIWNGQDAITEVSDTMRVGAFTVANLNDTDGDGVIDKDDDDDVPKEQDLMKLQISGYAGLTGKVKLTVKTGKDRVKFWEDKEKKNKPIALDANGAVFFEISGGGMNKTIWIEAITVSGAVRDIEIWEGYQPPQGVLLDGIDKVKATAVWAVPSNIFASGQGLPTTADHGGFRQLVQQYGDPSLYDFGVTDDAIFGYRNTVVHEFMLIPIEAGNEPGVICDITRRIDAKAWEKDMFTGAWSEIIAETESMDMNKLELPNDDVTYPSTPDEDNTPKNGLIYSMDVPGRPEPIAFAASLVIRMNFEEFVRVRFDGKNFSNEEKIEGSRCSPKSPWSSRHTMIRDNSTILYKRSGNDNGIFQGHQAIDPAPNN